MILDIDTYVAYTGLSPAAQRYVDRLARHLPRILINFPVGLRPAGGFLSTSITPLQVDGEVAILLHRIGRRVGVRWTTGHRAFFYDLADAVLVDRAVQLIRSVGLTRASRMFQTLTKPPRARGAQRV